MGKPSAKISPTTVVGVGIQRTSKGPMLPIVTARRDVNGNAVVNVQQNVRNPFQPFGGGIAANTDISVNQSATVAGVRGSISRTPSFEVNVTKGNGATTNIPLQAAPKKTGEFVQGLGQETQVDKTVQLNSKPPSAADVEPESPVKSEASETGIEGHLPPPPARP